MNKNRDNIKKTALLASFLAMGIILNILDSFIQMPFGFRIGLANIVSLIVLYIYGIKEAFTVTTLRILIAGMVRGTIGTLPFFMALTGGIIAIIVMIIIKLTKIFGIHVASILGAISHAIGQILMSMIIMGTTETLYFLPYLLLISVGSGVLIGIVASILIGRLRGLQKNA